MLDHTIQLDKPDTSDPFNLSIEGYDGPIDLLLDLAKKQKVDLSNISILELAEQYLNFIQQVKEIHLEIAADYLVMAAWLTYLKSRLLLPKDDNDDNHTPQELEAALKYQLQRLEAMKNVSNILYSKPLIGRDIFYRGFSKDLRVKYETSYSSTLFELLKSYSNIIIKSESHSLTIKSSELYSVDHAMQRMKRIFGSLTEWTNFLNLIPKFNSNKVINKSAISSNFVASLELVKNGFIEVKQEKTFGNIYVKVK